MKIRLSLGSAIALHKIKGKLDVSPTTLYLLTYKEGRCVANCSFCPQAKSSESDLDKLSRVTWPVFELEDLFSEFKSEKFPFLKRLCIQCLNYNNVENDAKELITYLKQKTDLPISLSIKPIDEINMMDFKKLGINKICFPLDAATENIFTVIKGRSANSVYSFKKHIETLKKALIIFGKQKVGTHLIIGLGEIEKDAIKFLLFMNEMGIDVGLFAFTPIKGTKLEKLEQPKIGKYRKIQLAHYLIYKYKISSNELIFNNIGELKEIVFNKEKLNKIIDSGEPFLTSGCEDCNRPFYNERISGLIYNYPSINLVKKNIDLIKHQLRGIIL
jgi:biotin synthase-related radical SAM superfamily protein